MISKILNVYLIASFAWFSLAQPSVSRNCEVAADLSSCRRYVEGSAPKPSGLCCYYRLAAAAQSSNPPCLRHALRGLASIAANKDRVLSLGADACKLQPHARLLRHVGSGTTEPPAESPKDMPASSTPPLHPNDGSEITESPAESPKKVRSSSAHSTDGFCPDCETGGIDPNASKRLPP